MHLVKTDRSKGHPIISDFLWAVVSQQILDLLSTEKLSSYNDAD
jgi:hypothetical protein